MRTAALRGSTRSKACRIALRSPRAARPPRAERRPGTRKNSLARRRFVILLLRLLLWRRKVERSFGSAGPEGEEHQDEACNEAHGANGAFKLVYHGNEGERVHRARGRDAGADFGQIGAERGRMRLRVEGRRRARARV